MYRVDRISDLAVGEKPRAFTKPKGFDIKGAVDSQPWEAGPDPAVETTVAFDPDVAWWAARRRGGDEPAGELTTTVSVSNRDAFIGWLLSFGSSAQVLHPVELREAVAARVEEAIGQLT
jgi:predicted DNA-binding transcriptional regulator YafY